MISIKIEIQDIPDEYEGSNFLTAKPLKKIEKLHPNYHILRKLSKRGTLDDDLIIRLQFF